MCNIIMKNLQIKKLTKLEIRNRIRSILNIDSAQMGRYEKWKRNNFFLDLPHKFQISAYVIFNNKLIGYCIGSIRGNTAHIHRLSVDTKYTNRGVGHIMIKFLKQRAKNYKCKVITVETLKKSEANKFYIKEKFSKCNPKERANYLLSKKAEIRNKFIKNSIIYKFKI